MKKRLFLVLFILASVFLLPDTVSAQTTAVSSPAGAVISPKLTRTVEIVSNNLKNTIAKLSNIESRIESRMTKMKERGLITTGLEKSIQSIDAQIQKLSEHLTQVEKLRESVNREGAKRTDLNAWRKQVTTLRQAILSVVKLQKNLIIEMKKLDTKPTTVE